MLFLKGRVCRGGSKGRKGKMLVSLVERRGRVLIERGAKEVGR